MGHESRQEFPRRERPVEEILADEQNYIERGLTPREASDLTNLDAVEYREGQLVDAEKERKRKYIKKMEAFEKDKK